MALSPTKPFSLLALSFLLVAAASGSAPYLETTADENTTHLHFYYHQIWDGPNATAFNVAGLKENPFVLFAFGNVAVIDDPLTEGPELNSTLIGKGQGLVVWPSKEDASVLVLFNLVFIGGKYNGSTLMVPGRVDGTGNADRPIVGGSGKFHGAQGYVITKFVSAVNTTFTTEYDVYITRSCVVTSCDCEQARNNKYLQQE